MIVFNDIEYDIDYYNSNEMQYSAYRFHNLKITSPHNIVDFTQMLLNGETPKGEVYSLTHMGESFKREIVDEIIDDGFTTLDQIEREALLKTMFQCNEINVKLLDVEECRQMDITSLRELTSRIPDQFDDNDIKAYLKLNKYDRDGIENSGFTDYDKYRCYKALFRVKEKFGDYIEYTNSLNNFMHKTYYLSGVDTPRNPGLAELMGIYYQYPHIADLLEHGDRKGAAAIYELIHKQVPDFQSYSSNWVFDEYHINALNQLESQLSYYYEHHEDKDDIVAYNIESNLYSFKNIDALITPSQFSIENNNIPKGILVQSDYGSEKYILPNFDNIVQTLEGEPYETIEIKELGLSFSHNPQIEVSDYERFRPIIEPLLEKIKEMANSKGISKEVLSLTYDDIYEDIRDKNITNTFSPKTIKEILQSIDKVANIRKFLELDRMSIVYHKGMQYTNENLSFKHCHYMKDVVLHPFESYPERRKYEFNRDKESRKEIFIMTKPMIQKLNLESSKELKRRVIFDKDFVIAIRDNFIDSARDVLQTKALHQKPIIKAQTPYVELVNAFKEKYGRTPRIMPQISVALNNFYKGNIEECVDSFNYKRVSKIQGAKTPIMIKLSTAYDWNRIPLELQQILKYNTTPSNIDLICKYPDVIIEFYYNAKHKDLVDFMNVIDKALDEDMNELRGTIEELRNANNNENRNEIRQKIFDEVTSMIAFVQQQKGFMDVEKAEESYSYAFINNSSSIMGDNICVMSGPYKAYFLNSLDARHFSVGYDTVCCQHMDGAGEECVIAATSSPHCGTFVIESDGVIKAQAFVWESINKDGNKVLVLDNIEFANDRDTRDYMEILYGFCKKSPYDTIHMGLSYNAIAHIGRHIDDEERVIQPTTAYIDGDFYSDYDSVVALKTNGKMEFDVADVKYYTHNFETPTIIESKSHCINEAKNHLVAQHYDGMANTASKTTMLFTIDGERRKPNEILPVYSFDTTTTIKHNNIMKWNDTQPGDIAITITHMPPQEEQEHGQYIVKPISFDGIGIKTPNSDQRRNIFKALTEFAKNNPNDKIILKTNQGDIVVETPNVLLQIQTDNYTSLETGDICGDELMKLEVAIDEKYHMDSERYDDMDFYDDYHDYDDYYDDYDDYYEEEDEYPEEYSEVDEEELKEEAFEDKWAEWEEYGDRL